MKRVVAKFGLRVMRQQSSFSGGVNPGDKKKQKGRHPVRPWRVAYVRVPHVVAGIGLIFTS